MKQQRTFILIKSFLFFFIKYHPQQNHHYNSIITNLSTPYQFDAEITMNKIMLNVRQFLNILHGRFINQTSISNSFLPSSLLSQFSQISLQIRNAHNFPSDDYYDDILNECLLDAVNEVISNERHYSNCIFCRSNWEMTELTLSN